MKRLAIAVVLAALTLSLSLNAADDGADEAKRLRVEQIHRAVFADPFDEQKLQAYMATLPRVGDYYIVEGDLLKTEQELRAYVVANAEASRPTDPRPELIVDTVGGVRNFYKDPSKRVLSYAIDRTSFGDNYQLVDESVAKAAREWEAICRNCRIRFVHETKYDSEPSTGKTNFIIRQEPLSGLVALAFFPADPPERRILRVAPSYATTAYDKVGVFRHELGHILGYRHEHIESKVKGCYRKETDETWEDLSTYDPQSVMHYPCTGAGSMTFKFSETDKRDHRTLYAVAPGPAHDPNATGLETPANDATREVLAAAVKDPFDDKAVTRSLSQLPRDGDYYIVEGDLLMTEAEVRAWLVAQSEEVRSTTPEGELLVNVVGQATDYYQKPSARRLTYAVARSSFNTRADYYRVVENMDLATQAWENACPIKECGIDFIHLQELDDASDVSKANFVVRLHDTGGEYVAASFFPHDPPERRYLNIDPSYFLTQVTRIGILRHELGHVLGYRHEHIRGIRGCNLEEGQWMPLTAYDPKSVMHYFCGGAGNIRLDLTDFDREGHRKLYGPPKLQGSGGLEQPDVGECVALSGKDCVTVLVRFEGGDVPRDTAAVLRALKTNGAIEPRHYQLHDKELLDTIVKRELNVPGLDHSLLGLIQNMNPGVDLDDLEGRSELILPRVKFNNYTYSVRLDKRVPQQEQELANINEHWQYLKTDEKKIGDWMYDVSLKGYQLKLAVPSDSVSRIRGALKQVESVNVNSYFPASPGKAPFFSYKKGEDYWKDTRNLQAPYKLPLDTEGFVGSSVGLNEVPTCLHDCVENCPRIVVFDRPIHLHADLASAIQEGGEPDGPQASGIEGTDQVFVSGSADKDKDHGTQIAGIIATQPNRYGLVGINPKAYVISLPYDSELRDNPLGLQNLLQNKVLDRNQIYVFASNWKISDGDDPVGDRIKRQPGLWVVAAGDPDDKVGNNITKSFSYGPMNLGDEGNVLVVTACADCYGDHPRLIESANYSKFGLVNLAAPGEMSVPTPIAGGRYDTMGGTSQAAAFVGAVASSLLSCFDNYYRNEPWLIKFRLLVTSNPKALQAGYRDRISNGVLDAALALQNPNVSFLDQNNSGRQRVTATAWCRDTISLYDSLTGDTLPNGIMETKNVYRIVRDGKQMYVYTSSNPVTGIVEKHGPGILHEESRPLLRTSTRDVPGSDVSDLLLHKRIGTTVSDCK